MLGISPLWRGTRVALAHWGSPRAGTCPPTREPQWVSGHWGSQEVPGDPKMCQDQAAAPVPSPASAPGPHPRLLRPRLGSHQPSTCLHWPALLGQLVCSPPPQPLPGQCVPKAPPHQPHLLPLSTAAPKAAAQEGAPQPPEGHPQAGRSHRPSPCPVPVSPDYSGLEWPSHDKAVLP